MIFFHKALWTINWSLFRILSFSGLKSPHYSKYSGVSDTCPYFLITLCKCTIKCRILTRLPDGWPFCFNLSIFCNSAAALDIVGLQCCFKNNFFFLLVLHMFPSVWFLRIYCEALTAQLFGICLHFCVYNHWKLCLFAVKKGEKSI